MIVLLTKLAVASNSIVLRVICQVCSLAASPLHNGACKGLDFMGWESLGIF